MNTSTAWLARYAKCAGLLPVMFSLLACGEDATGDPDRNRPNDEQPAPNGGMKEVDAPPMHAAAHDSAVRAPMDATPSPDGKRIYYTALARDAEDNSAAGVFSVDAKGGDITTLAIGGTLIAPVGISTSLDGKQLFVADSGVIGEAGVGAIVVLSASGGEASVLKGTEGYLPRGLVIANVQGKERLYFTGRDPNSAEHGVFRVAPSGGNVERIASGAPFADPAGVAVSDKGDAYVIDGLAGGIHAAVIRVRENRAELVVSDIGVGFPAGIATTRDAKTVLVSGLEPTTRRDRVYLLDTATNQVSVIRDVFDEFSEPAGLHRAHDADVFAWADSEANHDGTVYVIEL